MRLPLSAKERAASLAETIEAHYETGPLDGIARMIELTIQAAIDDHAWKLPPIGTGVLTLCPVSERPCGFPQLCDGRCRIRCEHLQTMQAVVGDAPGFTRIQTTCVTCGAVIP